MTEKLTTKPAKLLVVDDDSRYGEWLRHHIGVLCPDAAVSSLALPEFERWREMLAEGDCDVLLLAASFGSAPEDPNSHGLKLLRRLRERPIFPAIIAVAEDGNELTAVRALQLGAVDYLPKRLLTPERLSTSVRLALRRVERRAARRLAAASDGTLAGAATAAIASVTDGANGAAATTNAPSLSASAIAPIAASSATILPMKGPSEAGETRSSRTNGEMLAKPGTELIPGYTIRMKVGESEKAVVYLAASIDLGRNVALKVSKTLRDEAAGRQFLEREYTAIIAIQDPLVVTIYDYGVHGGYEYLAMEYLVRGDLKARMQLGVTEADALRYVEQIACALRVVHTAGLLHRDLKPPNVMLREDDTVALIDFGLARALDGSTPSTRTGVLRGSPYYMSPEQALGEQLDARSDFYSLGIMFYEMLTGRKPYTGSSALEVLQQHVNSPMPSLPHSLIRYEAFLTRLVAKSREDRFASADEIITAVGVLRDTAATATQSSAA